MNMRVKAVPPFETADTPEVNASLKIQERTPKVGDIMELVRTDANMPILTDMFLNSCAQKLLEVYDIHDSLIYLFDGANGFHLSTDPKNERYYGKLLTFSDKKILRAKCIKDWNDYKAGEVYSFEPCGHHSLRERVRGIIYPSADIHRYFTPIPEEQYNDEIFSDANLKEAHSSVVVDPVRHDEQPEPKVGQLWEAERSLPNSVGCVTVINIALGSVFYRSVSGYFGSTPLTDWHKYFRFQSDPYEQPVMMVTDPTQPSPELLRAFELLDYDGRQKLKEEFPTIRWTKEKEYWHGFSLETVITFNVDSENKKTTLLVNDGWYPEVEEDNYGMFHIRFVKK